MSVSKRDDEKCYRKKGGAIVEDDSFSPCDSIIDNDACCVKGDQCMPVLNGAHLCFSPNNQTDFISYYVAGCTDSSYKDGSCFNHCGKTRLLMLKPWITTDLCAQATRTMALSSGSQTPIIGPAAARIPQATSTAHNLFRKHSTKSYEAQTFIFEIL